MTETAPTADRFSMRKPQLLTPIVTLSWVNAALVLVMAVLGGRFFVEPSIIDVHGYIGNLFFVLVIAQIALIVYAGISGWLGKLLIALGVVAVLLVVGQLGLGYSGRESSTALSLHIPNGVLIFGISVAILSQTPHLKRNGRG